MGKRRDVEKFILKTIKDITQTDFNVGLYKTLFKKMNDKEFHKFMLRLRDDGDILNVIIPHDKGVTKITRANNFKVAKQLGFSFFQKMVYHNGDGKPPIQSKYASYVLLLPYRRTKQTIEKALSVSEDDKHVDMSTGQVTGASKSSSLSYPEIQLLNGMDAQHTIKELLSDRGGSDKNRVLKHVLSKYGTASENVLKNIDSRVPSNDTLKAYFAGMHLKLNI